jgi:hypothetical protein
MTERDVKSASEATHADQSLEEPSDSLAAASFELTEDQTLALLKRSDLTAETLTLLGRNVIAIKSRKVALAIATHPRTPRHISVPTLRRLFTFDLMLVTRTAAVPADIKRAAEEQILNRLESLSTGEKISLARRASGRVAAALLRDPDPRVVSTALNNMNLLEGFVVTALTRNDASLALFTVVSEHSKWSQRREVQIALLRGEKTQLERAREFAKNFSADFLREIVPEGRRSTVIASRADEEDELRRHKN